MYTAGAGKSTLLSVLFSLGPLNSGSVSIGLPLRSIVLLCLPYEHSEHS
eukprot:SAG31_NODE_3295_length_4448_cov_3.127616_7_plen_49_part_00